MGSAAHPFDALLGLEASLLQRGFDEGARAGELAGYAQGHALGAARGAAAGEELGFYCGAAEAVLLSRPAAAFGEEDRVRRVARQVVALASAAELANPPAAAATAAGGGGGGDDDDAQSDSEAPQAGGAGGLDVFAALQLVRAKFRLLTVLAKLPDLCYDPALRRGQKERSF